jgi:hypothetical protein
MTEVNNFQITMLKEQLAKETINYYKLVGYGAGIEECRECNSRIKQMEVELESRRDLYVNDLLKRQYEFSPTEHSF